MNKPGLSQVTVLCGRRRRRFGSMSEAVASFKFRVVGRRFLVMFLKELFLLPGVTGDENTPCRGKGRAKQTPLRSSSGEF